MASYLMDMYGSNGFANSKGSVAAQKLYEMGLITYPRTDSKRISSKPFVKQVESYVTNTFGTGKLQAPNYAVAKGSQDAHEAIRPTYIKNIPSEMKLSPDEAKAYEYI